MLKFRSNEMQTKSGGNFMGHSSVSILEAIDGLAFMPPIKLIVNDKVVYDDYEGDENVSLVEAIKGRFPDADKYVITYMNVEIVHFHHSIVEMRCEVEPNE
jgi:hypothetical protein